MDASPEAVDDWALCNHPDTALNCKWHGQIERFLVGDVYRDLYGFKLAALNRIYAAFPSLE